MKTKSLKKEPSMKKRETKATPAATSTDTSSHDIAEKPAKMPDEQEDKMVHEVALETLKVEGEEQAINEIQPIDHADREPDTCENDKIEASSTSRPLEEHKEDTAVDEEENKKRDECEIKNHEEEKEQGDSSEGQDNSKSSEQLEHNQATNTQEQVETKKEQDDHDDDEWKMNTHAGDENETESVNTENDKTELKEIEMGSEDAKLESEKVQPKRQDSYRKKDSPAYNDVIEETASKLAEKRKSKVSALVGAFETVISLQEPEGQDGQ